VPFIFSARKSTARATTVLERGWSAITVSLETGRAHTAAGSLETLFRSLLAFARRDRAFFTIVLMDPYRLTILAAESADLVGFNPLMNNIYSLNGFTAGLKPSALCRTILAMFEGAIRHQLLEVRQDCMCTDEEIAQAVGRALRGLLI
jgi:hypothetical protein